MLMIEKKEGSKEWREDEEREGERERKKEGKALYQPCVDAIIHSESILWFPSVLWIT